MASNTREKLALIVFALLIFLGLAGVCWYLVVGHSWNVAASNIDDSVGTMDGYTCIVFSGTTEPKAASTSLRASVESVMGSGSASSSNKQSGDSERAAGSSSSPKTTVDANKEAAQGYTADIGSVAAPVVPTQDDASATGGRVAPDSVTEVATDGESAEAEPTTVEEPNGSEASLAAEASAADESVKQGAAESESSSSSSSSTSVKATPAVSLADVAESYAEKSSYVLTLDTLTPGAYSEGSIVKRGEKRIGILSVEVPLTVEAAELAIEPFVAAKVDMLICVTPSKSYVKNASGFDIVVTTQDDSVSTIGETSNKTFYVAAPDLGKVGAVVVSPSNTVSAKVIESL